MSETKHTPTPWAVDREGPKILITRIHPDIADYKDDIGDAYTLADAAFIVQVVNAHEELVSALRGLLTEAIDMNAQLKKIGRGRPEDGAHPDCPIQMAFDALEKAEGRGE